MPLSDTSIAATSASMRSSPIREHCTLNVAGYRWWRRRSSVGEVTGHTLPTWATAETGAYAHVMGITGVHMLLYTPEADALRAVLRDVIGWQSVDAGEGWLIFRLPPAELGVHPSDTTHHEFSIM